MTARSMRWNARGAISSCCRRARSTGFDTGAEPSFTVIRLFTMPEGWVARFTGDAIAEAIPLYEGASAESAQ